MQMLSKPLTAAFRIKVLRLWDFGHVQKDLALAKELLPRARFLPFSFFLEEHFQVLAILRKEIFR